MPKFSVDVPFAGFFTGEVEAANEKEAISLAMEKINFRVQVDEGCDFECGEVEVLQSVSSGNVNHAPLNEASATIVDG